MANTWQLLIVATCSFILGSISALGKESPTKSESLRVSSYSPTRTQNNFEKRPITRSSSLMDLALPSSLTPDYARLQSQPSIYHSIIDGTITSRRIISPAQTKVEDLHTAAGRHHGHTHGKYYEYREVPKKKTWKFGYKRGNHKHHIERHENGKSGKHPHFMTKVKWQDKKSKGKGIHLWDYNHHDKKHHNQGY